jgi:hypothetical protein
MGWGASGLSKGLGAKQKRAVAKLCGDMFGKCNAYRCAIAPSPLRFAGALQSNFVVAANDLHRGPMGCVTDDKSPHVREFRFCKYFQHAN